MLSGGYATSLVIRFAGKMLFTIEHGGYQAASAVRIDPRHPCSLHYRKQLLQIYLPNLNRHEMKA